MAMEGKWDLYRWNYDLIIDVNDVQESYKNAVCLMIKTHIMKYMSAQDSFCIYMDLQNIHVNLPKNI